MPARNADDVVDVLLSQHEHLRQLLTDVSAPHGDDRKRPFSELADLLHIHENGEQIVVHPAVRDKTPAGGIVAVLCRTEEDGIEQAAAELLDLGMDHPTFEARFVAFRKSVLDHIAHEEADEYPRLRQYLPAQRLHAMANELRNVQTMS